MADDPMERSKRELARSISSVINHCVSVSQPLHRHAPRATTHSPAPGTVVGRALVSLSLALV